MTSGDLLNRYAGFATNLGIDLVAILAMTYVLYFRRHWRSDLLLSYVALNRPTLSMSPSRVVGQGV